MEEENETTPQLMISSFRSLPGINRYRHFSPGYSEKFEIKLPSMPRGKTPEHLDVREFQMEIKWVSGYRFRMAQVLEKYNLGMLEKIALQMRNSRSEWIKTSKNHSSNKDDGEK